MSKSAKGGKHALESKRRKKAHQKGEHRKETAPVGAHREQRVETGSLGGLGDPAGELGRGREPKGLTADGKEDRFAALTEKKVIDALVLCRGDVLQASKYLRLSVRELDNVMRAIPGIGAVLGTIEEVKAQNPDYEKLTIGWFEAQCSRAMQLYRLAALDELYALATMEISANAAMMQVKREAAVNLLGRDHQADLPNELSGFFKMLNTEYQQKRTRVMEIRAQLIEMQPQPQPTEKILEALPPAE